MSVLDKLRLYILSWSTLFLIFFISASWIAADPIKIVTSEEPPLNFIDENGKLTGISVDVVQEIQKRVDSKEQILLLPWPRVIKTVTSEPGIVAFTLARTPEREEKYNWVTAVNRNVWMLFAKKSRKIDLTRLDEAKRFSSICVVRSDIRGKILQDQGFKNLTFVTSYEQSIQMLLAERVDLVFFAESGLIETCRKANLDCSDIESIYTLQMADAYIVISLKTPPAIVTKWKNAAEQMKKDGTFDRIALKWKKYLRYHYGLETHLKDGALNLWKGTM